MIAITYFFFTPRAQVYFAFFYTFNTSFHILRFPSPLQLVATIYFTLLFYNKPSLH